MAGAAIAGTLLDDPPTQEIRQMTDTEETAPSTDLVDTRVAQGLEALKNSEITWSKITDIIAAPPPPAVRPSRLPMPVEITDEQRSALARLPEVFGRVVPTQARELEDQEIADLFDERQVLDEVSKMAETRKDNIRTTIYNHLDAVTLAGLQDEEGNIDDASLPPVDDKGWFLKTEKDQAPIPGTDQCWSREPAKGKAVMDPEVLRTLAQSDEYPEFSHKDFLLLTTQVRVFDENKAMLMLKKRPELLRVIAAATSRGKGHSSLYVRKQK